MPTSADHASPMNAAGYASRRVTKPPNWHGLVALDMLFNNMTTGLFLVAAVGELMSRATFGPLARLAYPLALLFLTIDLACLVLDLGHRFRFHHMLRVFKPTSPMSLGTWSLTAYSLPLGLLATIEVLADFVLLMVGYRADMSLARMAGVELNGADEIPTFDPETMETNVPGVYIAGTATGGTQAQFRVFLENCHIHVDRIVAALTGVPPPKERVSERVVAMPES